MLETSILARRRYLSWPQLMLLTGLLFVVSGYTMARMQVEPFWFILAALSIFVVQFVIRKFPILLMVGMVYVGTLKNRAAVGVSLTDPTLVTAGVLYLSVALQILLSASGHAKYRLKDLFTGQIAGLLTCCLLFIF